MTLAQAAHTETSARETRDEWIDRHSGRIMVLPAVIVLLCFAIFPLIISAYLSLSRFALARRRLHADLRRPLQLQAPAVRRRSNITSSAR